MSWLNCPDPVPGVAASCDPIDTIIVPPHIRPWRFFRAPRTALGKAPNDRAVHLF